MWRNLASPLLSTWGANFPLLQAHCYMSLRFYKWNCSTCPFFSVFFLSIVNSPLSSPIPPSHSSFSSLSFILPHFQNSYWFISSIQQPRCWASAWKINVFGLLLKSIIVRRQLSNLNIWRYGLCPLFQGRLTNVLLYLTNREVYQFFVGKYPPNRVASSSLESSCRF